MSVPHQLLIFALDEQVYAIDLAAVVRVVRAVEVTPLPDAPGAVLGVINLHGQVVSVYALRRRFGLRERPVGVSDQIIVADTARRRVALVVDGVRGVVECDAAQVTAASQIAPGVIWFKGVLQLGEELAVIHDLETFLSPDEQSALDTALGEWH